MPVPPASQSLVHYDTPILLSESKKRGVKNGSLTSKKGAGAVKAAQQIPQTEDILNSIIPPRQFDEDGQQWVQFVSPSPATRLDVINLQENLDKKLLQRQARETGICPIREELYAQAFDEVIRQVTVNCAERGLLLLRVRDEIRMTLAAYRTLYESSVAFGMRKALHAEQNKVDMQATIRALEREKEELEAQVASLNSKCESIERREAERRAADERKHIEDVNFLRKTHQTLTSNLQTIINPSKK